MESFTFKPSFDVQVEISWNVITSRFENGVEQRRPKESSAVRVFTFNFGVRTVAQIKLIEDFWTARKGSFEAFTWTDPKSSTTFTVRFVEGGFKKQYLGGNYASLTLQFQETK